VRTPNSPKSRRRATPRPNGARDLFEGRFSEILIIFVLALIVLGPEKLPRVVSEVGRWVGRARSMARQFREQLEEEVQLEEARKAQAQRTAPPPPPEPAPVGAAPPPAAPLPEPASAPAVSAHEPASAPAVSAHEPAPAAAPTAAAGNGRSALVTHDTTHRDPPSAASGADPTATRPAPTGSADERRT
jgi:sec-independent protein translocase protein TatB